MKCLQLLTKEYIYIFLCACVRTLMFIQQSTQGMAKKGRIVGFEWRDYVYESSWICSFWRLKEGRAIQGFKNLSQRRLAKEIWEKSFSIHWIEMESLEVLFVEIAVFIRCKNGSCSRKCISLENCSWRNNLHSFVKKIMQKPIGILHNVSRNQRVFFSCKCVQHLNDKILF